MEKLIAHFMLRAAKFEFYLINKDIGFAQTKHIGELEAISGVQWSKVAQHLQEKFPFESFDFDASSFALFKKTAPQLLVKGSGQRPQWDSDNEPQNSWERLLGRGYAQLRNNIAHGNKAQIPVPFTHGRTIEFLQAGNALIDFIAEALFGERDWEEPLAFR